MNGINNVFSELLGHDVLMRLIRNILKVFDKIRVLLRVALVDNVLGTNILLRGCLSHDDNDLEEKSNV